VSELEDEELLANDSDDDGDEGMLDDSKG